MDCQMSFAIRIPSDMPWAWATILTPPAVSIHCMPALNDCQQGRVWYKAKNTFEAMLADAMLYYLLTQLCKEHAVAGTGRKSH